MTWFLKKTWESNIPVPSVCKLLQRGKWKHSDSKHDKLAWNVHSPGEESAAAMIKTTQNIIGTHLPSISVIGEVRCLHWAQRIKQYPPQQQLFHPAAI